MLDQCKSKLTFLSSFGVDLSNIKVHLNLFRGFKIETCVFIFTSSVLYILYKEKHHNKLKMYAKHALILSSNPYLSLT
jgi:hypothetical protein